MPFSVWAPLADRVTLRLDNRDHEMGRVADGWWEIDVEADPGARYGFALDGGEVLPDPRSPFQPDGVDGLSMIVDHEAFVWSDDGFVPPPFASWIVYELHVGTFTREGTYESAVSRLPHLVELGITAVELMPVNTFSGDHGWGYDGVDLYAPHRAYGTPDDLKRFVDECHRLGLAVVMDVVYNHLGPSGNYLPRFGPYFTSSYSTPWGDAINFDDSDCGPVREFFLDNALMWLRDYHCDALRLDAIHAILDRSAVHILEEMRGRVDELEIEVGRPKYLIAESDLNDPRIVRAREVGGYGMNAQWSDDLHHSIHAVLSGEAAGYYGDFGSVGDIAKALQRAFVYDGGYSAHRRRRHGREPTGLDGASFLGYLQTHDQVGNRAIGDRITSIVGTDLAKVGAALVLTSPFIPMLFQGEEWGASTPFLYFTDHPDPDLGRAVSEGRRREFAAFGWNPQEIPDPQDPSTFESSKLTWDEIATEPHNEMLEWYRALIKLRAEQPSLQDPILENVRVQHSEEPRWIVMERDDVTIACNFDENEVKVDIDPERTKRLLLSSKPLPDDPSVPLLPPRSVALWTAK
jgi:maltooligosyltrehalose trehalohydrolase